MLISVRSFIIIINDSLIDDVGMANHVSDLLSVYSVNNLSQSC